MGWHIFIDVFIINFASIMALITKLLVETKVFKWTIECQTAWKHIKNQYIQALILINPTWELVIHVHINAS
jgi:hypothetical protein